VVTFDGVTCASREPLRSPVSGQPCVYWRLRVVEHIPSRLQLVHEVASPEPFELEWGKSEPGRPPVRVRLDPESARIQAAPVLHREGTPGAVAAARYLGLDGPVYVEEVIIRLGESVSAEGVLEDPGAGRALFRAADRGPELLDATISLETRSLGPALLPWALGTAAALLSGMGVATYAAWRYHLAHLPSDHRDRTRLVVPSAEIGPPAIPYRRFP
jgi:hypothetical protein